VCVGCFLFGGWLGISTLQQLGVENGRYSYNGGWQWVGQLVLMICLARLFQSRRIASTVCVWMMALAAGTVANTLFQYWVVLPNARASFETDPNMFLTRQGIVAGSSVAIQFANRLGSPEPTGMFNLTNSLAGYLLVWILLAGCLFIWNLRYRSFSRSVARKDRFSFSLLAILLGGMAFVLWLTRSRSAFLATGFGIASIALVPFLKERVSKGDQNGMSSRSAPVIRRWTWIGGGAGLLLLCAVIGMVREPQLLSEAGKSLSYRMDYWRGACAIVSRRPWFGVGTGNFQSNYTQVKSMTASESPADPHNFLLEVAVAGGIPLLVLVGLLIVGLIWLGLKTKIATIDLDNASSDKRSTIKLDRWIGFGVVVACLGIGLFYSLAFDMESLYGAWLFVLVTLVIGWTIRGGALSGFVYVQESAWLIAGALLLHLCFSGGWMTPGVMNSFCVLVGLMIGRPFTSVDPIESDSIPASELSSMNHRMLVGIVPLTVAVLLLASFLRTTCIPALSALDVLDHLDTIVASSGELGVENAIQVDRWDPELPRVAANQSIHQLSRRNLASVERVKWFRVFNHTTDEFLRRDPQNWLAASECGRWNMMIADSLTRQSDTQGMANEHIGKATRQFARAAELYPSSIECHLQAAVALAWSGDWLGCRLHLEKIDEIDRVNSHADRKLAAILVDLPISFERSLSDFDPIGRQNLEGLAARGEPVSIWLRRHLPTE
jgi:O-antigen ligase